MGVVSSLGLTCTLDMVQYSWVFMIHQFTTLKGTLWNFCVVFKAIRRLFLSVNRVRHFRKCSTVNFFFLYI